jgi:murein DD-endopeptidase MepM/ murein hydrolase activator NlpD
LAGSGQPGRGSYFDGSVHLGDDLRAAEGDPVYAIGKGEVMDARMNVSGFGLPLKPGGPPGLGGAIVIDHSMGGRPLVAVYGHLKELRVEGGDRVDPGDHIASVGPWHRGVHLHIGLRHGAIPRGNWGLAPIDMVLHDGEVDTLGWQDPCEVLHAAR